MATEFFDSCISSFAYSHGAAKMMETSLRNKNVAVILEALSKISFSMDLYKVIKQLLPEERFIGKLQRSRMFMMKNREKIESSCRKIYRVYKVY